MWKRKKKGSHPTENTRPAYRKTIGEGAAAYCCVKNWGMGSVKTGWLFLLFMDWILPSADGFCVYRYFYICIYDYIWEFDPRLTDSGCISIQEITLKKKKKKGIVFFDRNLNLKRLKDKSGIDNGTRWHQCLNKRPSSFIIPFFFFCLILILFYFLKIISNIPMYLQIVFVWSRFPRFPGEPMEVWNK